MCHLVGADYEQSIVKQHSQRERKCLEIPPPPDDSACRTLSWKAPRIRMVNLEQHTESGHVAYCCEAPDYHPPS